MYLRRRRDWRGLLSRVVLSVALGTAVVGAASSAFARATESQRNYATGTGSVTAWWRTAVTAHHLLIAGVTYSGGSGVTITPPAGWQQIDTTLYRSDNGTTIGTAIYYIADSPAKVLHTTETFTFSPSTTVATVQLTEVAGIVTSSPVDSIGNKTGTGNSIAITASTAPDETSEYGYVLVASAAQSASFGNGTNGFARTSSYLYNTSTQATNLDAGTSHRTNMESTLMTSAAGAGLSTTITAPNAAYSATLVTFKVQALYWIGAGSYPARPVNPSTPDSTICYGYFDDDACWSTSSGGVWTGTASPGSNDVVIFDAGGLGDCTMSPWDGTSTEQAYSIEIQSGYVGAITKSTTNLLLQRHFTIGGGTFNGSAGINFRTNQTGNYIGDLDVQGGTVHGNGMTWNVRSLYVESGTFDVGSGTFNTNNGGIGNIAGGTTTFGGAAAFGSSLTMSGGSVTGGAGGLSVATTATLTGGTLTGGAGATSISGTTTVTGASIAGGGGSMSFAAVTLNTLSTMNLAAASTQSFTGNVQVLTGSSLTLGAGGSSMSPSTFSGTLTVRGSSAGTSSTFTAGSGYVTVTGATVIDQTAAFNAGSGTLSFTGAVTVGASGSAGTFNAQTATVNFNNATASGSNSLLVQNASSNFNGNTATINFGNNTSSGARALNLSAATCNLANAAVSFNGAGNLISSGSLTFGSGAVTIPGATSVSGGTVTGGAGALTFTGAVTNSGGQLSLANPSALTFSTSLTVSGGTTTFGAQTVSLPTLTVSSGTFNAGTSNLTVTGAFSSAGTSNLSTAASLAFGSSFTITNGTTTLGSQTVSIPSLSVTTGTLNAGTAAVTVTGATSTFSGTANFSSTTSGPTFQGLVTMSGCTVTLGSGTAAIQAGLTMSGGTLNAGSTRLTVSSLSMTGGTFNANTSQTTMSGATAIAGTTATAGGTFNVNTASVIFSGQVTLGGSDGSIGTMNGGTGTLSFEYPTTLLSPDALYLQGAGTFTVSNTNPSATITFGRNAISGTNAINLAGGTASLSIRNGTNVTITAGNVNIASGTTFTAGVNNTTFPGNVTVAGTLVGSTGGLTFQGPVSVSGTFSGSSGARTFSSTLDVTSSGTYTASTGAHAFTGAATSAGVFNLASAASPLVFSTSLSVTGGTTSTGSVASVTIPTLAVSGGAFNVTNAGLTVTGDVNITGGTTTLSNTTSTITFSSNLNVGPGTLTVGAAATASVRRLNVNGATNVTAGGVINAGASTALTFSGTATFGAATAGSAGTFNGDTSTTTFSNTVTVRGGSTFNVGAATLITLSNTFSLLGSSSFSGGTGSATFNVAPTLTSGTFTVASAGSTGIITLSQGATVPIGATLAFPTDRGTLRLGNGRTLTVDGTVTSNVGTTSTLPKIDCNGCASGITVAFGATSTLNVNGLEIDNSVAAGVSIASGARYTLFKRLKFASNKGGASSVHLVMTLGTEVVNAPGCFFDTTAATNVRLLGTSGQLRGARAIFESQSTSINGAGAGESLDADGDNSPGDPNPGNNLGEDSASPYFGSVVQWSAASPTDIVGTAEGSPTAAFDFNTFAPYAVYVEYKNIGGAGTADRLWVRNTDGTSAYFFDVPDASGDLVGAPTWGTANETTLGLDVNGDGDQADTNLHYVYLATTAGHVIKLIDSGSALARPVAGAWSTDFTDSNVVTISSPLATDQTNLYFGGTDSSTTKLFGVQVSAGAAEKTLVKNIGSVSAINAAIAWKRISGIVYAYLGSAATSNQAYIYRINVSPGAVIESTFSGLTAGVNGSIRLANNRAYAVTDNGQLHALDAINFTSGGFTNVSGYPYQTTAGVPIQAPAWIDSTSQDAYFGDDSGKL